MSDETPEGPEERKRRRAERKRQIEDQMEDQMEHLSDDQGTGRKTLEIFLGEMRRKDEHWFNMLKGTARMAFIIGLLLVLGLLGTVGVYSMVSVDADGVHVETSAK